MSNVTHIITYFPKYASGVHKTFRNCSHLNQLQIVFETTGFSDALDAFAKLRKATISFVMSVRLFVWNNLIPTGRILMTFDIETLFENLSRFSSFIKIRQQ
jgi:hypothetical protein